MIEALGLSKFYGPFAAIKDVTFEVSEGEVVAFLGPNGAGKSTTMKLLTGYLSPSAGCGPHCRSRHAGGSTGRLGAARLSARKWSALPRHDSLQSVGVLCRRPRHDACRQASERIEAVIELCALGNVIHKPISKLSKGYRQRAGMAQALLHEPDVLILDEPTVGLDPNQIREVRRTMERLRDMKKTVLLSTHILQEVEAMASRVILIDEGKLKYDGAVKDLDPDRHGLDAAFARLTKRAG